MEILGYILMTIATLCLIPIALYSLRELVRGDGSGIVPKKAETFLSPADEKFSKVLPTDTVDWRADEKEKLKVVTSGQTITLTEDLTPRSVEASVTLHEMTQLRPEIKDSPWSKTGVASNAVVLSGDIWILKVPGQEGGKPEWFKTIELDTLPLERFYKGGDASADYGPARKFKVNGQTVPVPYTLPNGLTEGVVWNIVDIGRFEAEVDGGVDNVKNGDMLSFVTSRENNGDRYLIYLDARKGMARGSGGLFLGTPFEPSVEIMDLM